MNLSSTRRLHVEQVLEGFEIVLGWETRNKYRIFDENHVPVAYAAEQSNGFLSFLSRKFFGHWRSFEVTIFDQRRIPVYQLEFPFRWLFKTLFVRTSDGKPLGHIQQRFAIFSKKFDLHNDRGQVIARINSPLFSIWTFEFKFRGRKLGSIQKKWSGILNEVFTDKDDFIVSFDDPGLTTDKRALMLSACLMVDIVYFENNQSKKAFWIRIRVCAT
jgi:uncharacterized protein YxjI